NQVRGRPTTTTALHRRPPPGAYDGMHEISCRPPLRSIVIACSNFLGRRRGCRRAWPLTILAAGWRGYLLLPTRKLKRCVSVAAATRLRAIPMLRMGRRRRHGLVRLHRWQLARAPVRTDRNISQASFGDLDADHLARIALRVHLHVDGHRRATHVSYFGVKAHDVTDEHRLLEHE